MDAVNHEAGHCELAIGERSASMVAVYMHATQMEASELASGSISRVPLDVFWAYMCTQWSKREPSFPQPCRNGQRYAHDRFHVKMAPSLYRFMLLSLHPMGPSFAEQY